MPTTAHWNVNIYLNPTSETPVTPVIYNISKPMMADNETIVNKTGGCANSVHDIGLDKSVRLLILYLTIVFGIVGGLLVLIWMACNKRLTRKVNHMSRVNSFILNLTIADLCVILLAVLPQLVWEYSDREWTAGPVMCKLVKFLQTFSITCSNYMLVVIAIDRHQAIRYPLKESIAVWKLAGAGWLMAALVSSPVFYIFRVNVRDGIEMCENVFREKPLWHRQLWLTFSCVAVFMIPLIVLAISYIRIFLKIAAKATRHESKKPSAFKQGKVHLQATHSSLPKAKIKTLKMTFVIILVFMVCSAPYVIVEMIMSFGDHCIISKKLYAILGGMAASNSATNPFVFLLFNINLKWIKEIRKCSSGRSTTKRHCMSSMHSTNLSHCSVHRNSGQVYQACRQECKENGQDMEMKEKYGDSV